MPHDKCPLDILSEMGDKTQNAWIFLHRNAFEKLRSTADKHVLKSDFNHTLRSDYNHLLQDFCEKVYFYHPLIMMDNNFISIDTYNYWRKIYKEQWDEVTKKDPGMFAILDALVKSRKIYLKEINK